MIESVQDMICRVKQAFALPAEEAVEAWSPLLVLCTGGGAELFAGYLRRIWPRSGGAVRCVDMDASGCCVTPDGKPTALSDTGQFVSAMTGGPFLCRDRLALMHVVDLCAGTDTQARREMLETGLRAAEAVRRTVRNTQEGINSPEGIDGISSPEGVGGINGPENMNRPEGIDGPETLIVLFSDSSVLSELREVPDLRRESERIPVLLLCGGENAVMYNAAAAFTAVWNSPKPPYMPAGYYAAGYIRAERPVEAVSWLCVLALLGELSREGSGAELLRERKAFRTRLGFENTGAYPFLRDMLTRTLDETVPVRPEVFPRAVPDLPVPENISARAFGDMTFGTWNLWLTEAVQAALKSLRHTLSNAPQWRDEFAVLLRERCSAKELTVLAENADKAARLLAPVRAPSGELPLRLYAETWLQYLFSTVPELNLALAAVIRREGETARKFLEQWQALLRTVPEPPPDSGLESYREFLQNYFMRNGPALRKAFRPVKDTVAMSEFLEHALDTLLSDETLILAAGADLCGELEFRMKAAPEKAVEHLARTLCRIPSGIPSDTNVFCQIILSAPEEALYSAAGKFLNPEPDHGPDHEPDHGPDHLSDTDTPSGTESGTQRAAVQLRFHNTGQRGAAEGLALYHTAPEQWGTEDEI